MWRASITTAPGPGRWPAAMIPGTSSGRPTAPPSSSPRPRTFDPRRVVEEDNYVAALEWADSLGVILTSASLGYTCFDDGSATAIR